ncbi:MAG: hypothetical protein HY568_01000 [Candidatus Latescibacteria bacterium]|nr:hypothetical protein [Candidatus Latescibacterota bacterium]
MSRSSWMLAALVAGFGALVPAPSAAAAPPGYSVDGIQARAIRPAWVVDTTGDFRIRIRRDVSDSTAGRLLGIAEAVYPPRELLIRIAEANGHEMGPDSAGAALWWCDGLGLSRVPYAVTAGAVDHYAALTERFQRREFREAGMHPLFRSDLYYHATIAPRDTFVMGGDSYPHVYVAFLRLVWTYDDGTFVPRVEAHRTVVLTGGGEVLAVDGDGGAKESVTISRHRGIGRQERMLR